MTANWAAILPPPWVADAACAGTDPEIFYPEKGNYLGVARIAKRICGRCPVRQQCLDDALDRDDRYGIWGGAGVGERRRIRSQRAAAARTARPVSPWTDELRALAATGDEPAMRAGGLKRCCVCREWLPLAAFYARRDSADGRAGRCKACNAGENRARLAGKRPVKVTAAERVKAAWTDGLRELAATGDEPAMRAGGLEQCGRCRAWLPVAAFSADRTRPTGRMSWCKACVAEAQRARRAAMRQVSTPRRQGGNR